MGATESLMEEAVGYDNVHPLHENQYNEQHQVKREEYMEIGIGEEEKVWTLRGFVCGDEGVGRKTLIRKLRGETTTAVIMTEQQKQQEVDNRRKRWMALVSWRPNVQLHVVLPPSTDAIAKTISTNHHRPCQFVLLLMDPRKSSSWEYTKNILSLLLSDNNKDTNRNSRIENIAILLNFHDLKQPNKVDEEEEVILTREQVAKYIKEQQSSENENIRIQIYNISLHNGYGWKHVFNNFFHTVYLQTQQQFYQNKLQSIQSSLQSIHTLIPSQTTTTTARNNSIPISNTLSLSSSKPKKKQVNETEQKKQVVSTQHQQALPKKEDIVENHKPKNDANGLSSTEIARSTNTTTLQTNRKEKPTYEPKEAKKITLKQPVVQNQTTFKNTKDALEAFLASSSDSSDDDNRKVVPRHKQSFHNRTKRVSTKKVPRNPQIFQSSSSSSSDEEQVYQQVYDSNDTSSSSEDEHVTTLPKDRASSKFEVASENNQSYKIQPDNQTTVSNEVEQEQQSKNSTVKQNENNKAKKPDTEEEHAKEVIHTKNLGAAYKATDTKVNSSDVQTSDQEKSDEEEPSQEKSNNSRLMNKMIAKDTYTSPVINDSKVEDASNDVDDDSEDDDDLQRKERHVVTSNSDQPHDNENSGKEESSDVVKSKVIQNEEKEGQSSLKEPGTLSKAALAAIASLEENMKQQQKEQQQTNEENEETNAKKKKKKKATRGEEGGKKKKKSKKKQEDGDVDERKERKRKKKKKPTLAVTDEA